MIYFTEEELDRILNEDVPYLDLTTYMLGIEDKKGRISYTARHDMVICGTEEVKRIFEKFRVDIEIFMASSTFVKEGTTFLSGIGKACDLHFLWRATSILLEYASGIATRTYKLVTLAQKENPDVVVVTTRKHFPMGKKLSIKAILAGGALPHRLGLSETILIFEEHIRFCGDFDDFLKRLEGLKKKVPEKKIVLEVKDLKRAEKAIEAGVDILQLDKFKVSDVKKVVDLVKKSSKDTKIAVAGGINESNIKEYARAGADILVLSNPYFGKPADIKVDLRPI